MALWSSGGCVAALLAIVMTSWHPVEGRNSQFVVCYYSSWAHYRNGLAKYRLEDIPVDLCTHLIYAFATLDSKTFLAKPFDKWLDIDLKNYENFVKLKEKNPTMKVLLGVGGWNDSRSTKYSRMVADVSKRRKFSEEVVKFLLQYGFDGLDLDWEYPGYESTAADKDGFTSWVEDLKTALTPHNLLLASAVSASRRVIDKGYDVPKIVKHLDFINLMAYDFHGSWERVVAHHSPLYPEIGQNPEFNADFAVNYWIKKGAPAHKIILGVPLYGRSWTLAGSNNYPGSAARGAGKRSKYVKESGHMAYFECCLAHQEDGWAKVTGDGGPYLTKDDQWVGYDDIDAVVKKAEYANTKGLGGIMVWDTVSDDFNNACGDGKNPLLTAISKTLQGNPPTTTETPNFSTTILTEPPTTASSRQNIWNRGNSWTQQYDGGNFIGGDSGIKEFSNTGSNSGTSELPYDWLAWPIFSKSPQDIPSTTPRFQQSFTSTVTTNDQESLSGFNNDLDQTTKPPYDWLSWPIFNKSPENTQISSSSSVTSRPTSASTRFQSSFTSRVSPEPDTAIDNKGSNSIGSDFSQTTKSPYQWLSWPIFNKPAEDNQNTITSSDSGSSSFVTPPPNSKTTRFQSFFTSRSSTQTELTTDNKDSVSTVSGSDTKKSPYEWLSWPIFSKSSEETKNSVSSFSARTTSLAPSTSTTPSSSKLSSSQFKFSSSSSSASSWFDNCKSLGFAADPASCSAFYRCTDKYAYRFSCPGGLVWHQEESSCDWPHAVQCIESLTKTHIEAFLPPEKSFS